MNQPGLIVIFGTTATGKTRIAIELAKHLGSPILSADSRQVYRYLDIGTAKPSMTERQGVPHYLIDIVEPGASFTLAEYQQQAQALITQFQAQGITPILVGGTGLYIRSIARGMQIPQVSPQAGLRSQLSQLGQAQCYAMLQQVDPHSAKAIHANDSVRTLRSLEVFYVTGMPLSTQQSESPPSYPIYQIGLTAPEREVHMQWISDRCDRMLALGWLEEIQHLQQQYGKNLPLLRTLGYAEMADYLDHKSTLAEAQALTVLHTLQFAKRQRTWFSNPKNLGINNAVNSINWVSQDADPSQLLDLLDQIHDAKDR
jgi:tRNA dimethylallyltransferase